MSSAPSNFRKTDVRRAIEGVEMAGRKAAKVVLEGGKISIVVADGDAPVAAEINPWDKAVS